MKHLLLVIFLVVPILLTGKTITASGSSNSAVQDAINQANDGDTVSFSGNSSWSGGVSCGKAITIDGSGATITHGAGSADLFSLTTSPAGHLTIANIKFQPGSATGRYLSISGSGQGIIVHDCYFALPNFQLTTALTKNATGGLFYNCTWEGVGVSSSSGPGSGSGCCQVRSNLDWYAADTDGAKDTNGDKNTYFEDCTWKDMYNQAIDVDDNERVVLRYSNFINSQAVTHGITSKFGGRYFEAYNNKFVYERRNNVWVNCNRYFWSRAGSGLFTNNSFDKLDSGGYWGGWKPSLVFIDEPLTRSGAGNGNKCESESQYPGTRWPGTGTNGKSYPTGQIVSPSPVNPFYCWANTGPAEPSISWGTNDQSGYGCSGGSTKNVFKSGRDIIFASKPGYQPYTYPHPWRGSQPSPSPTPQPTATPSPSGTPVPPTPTPTPSPSATPTPTPSPSPPPKPVVSYSDWLNSLADFIRTHPAVPNTVNREALEQGTEPERGQ